MPLDWLVSFYDCYLSLFVYLSYETQTPCVFVLLSCFQINLFIIQISERDIVGHGRKLQHEGTGNTLMQPLEEPELHTLREVPLLTEETQPEQYIEVSQEPSVIHIQTLHEEHAASFMQPFG